MRQLALPLGMKLPPSFESFRPGLNAPALALLLELLQLREDGGSVPPIYLCGPSGCGKSHLLRALGGHLRAAGERVGWFDAGTALPWTLDREPALTVLDDCDGYDADRQQAAFALFADASSRGALVAAAGRAAPAELALREDLRTRLGWGHVITLAPLGDADLAAALADEAERRGLVLRQDVTDYLLARHARDAKSLFALLDRIDEFALQHQRAPTIPMLRQMLSEPSDR
jgi:DnaA family protein